MADTQQDEDRIARLRRVLYFLEDEGAITCRDRGDVAGRILRELDGLGEDDESETSWRRSHPGWES